MKSERLAVKTHGGKSYKRLLRGDPSLTLAQVQYLVLIGKAVKSFGLGGEEIYAAVPHETKRHNSDS